MAAQILYLDTRGMGVVSFNPRLFTQEKEPIGPVYHTQFILRIWKLPKSTGDAQYIYPQFSRI
jgi:hypothetical protein